MHTEWSAALSHAVHEVFENLCFMLPREETNVRGEGEASLQAQVLVEVSFDGSQRGLVRVALPAAMLPLVASAMLGEDVPVPLAEQEAAVRELANIVCGNVLPRIAGERAVFDLGVPRLVELTEPRLEFASNVRVVLEEGVVEASIAFHGASEKECA